MANFSERVRELREERGLKQTEMADKLDMERMESLTQTDNCTVIQFHMDKEFEPERRKGI